MMKSCSVCSEEKPINMFYSNRAKPSGTESACIDCFKKRLKKYYSKDYIPTITQNQLSEERWHKIILDGAEYPYKISDCGRLLILRTGKIAKPALDQRGYPQVVLTLKGKKKTRRIHILVATFFVANPNFFPEVNHKDGNKFNPHYTNLEWNTSKQNKHHSIVAGLWKPHEINPKSRKVIDVNTGKIFVSVREASDSTGIGYDILWNRLVGNTKNKTSLKYL